MKLFVKIGFFLFFPILVKAQSKPSQLASLQLRLKNAPSDTVRMNTYDQLGWYYAEIDRDSALSYFEKELPISRKLKFRLYEADALNGIGYALEQLGNYPKSLESYLDAQKIARDLASEKNAWNITHNAWNTSKSPDPKDARRDLLGWILIGAGGLYGRTGNTNTEISYAFEARSLAASVRDTTLLEVTNAALGNAYFRLNKLDSALLFLQEALSLYNSSDVFRKYEGDVLMSIGKIYQKKGDFGLSKDVFLKSAKINEEQDNLSGLGGSYLSLANLYQAAKNPDTGMFYARKALETFKKVSLPSGISDAYSLVSAIYAKQNKPDSAFTYLKLAAVIKDSLANAERTNLLAFKNRDFDEIIKVKELEEEKIQTQTRVRIFALLAGISVFILITLLLYRNNKQRQKANALLQKQKEEIEIQKGSVERTLVELKATQAQLIQSEKMASLGELTAAIAHEIQNPLNFVNNFSEVNKELLVEMKVEMNKGNIYDANTIANDVIDNEEKINHHGKRADAIVKGMLQHSRAGSGQKELTDINALADEYLRLSYHGMRAKDKLFNAEMKTDLDASIRKIDVVPQDIGRVLLNLYNNAFYAVNEKAKQQLNGYEPTIAVSTKKINNTVELTVKDNGSGIPQKVLDKIFQPFFTTKPTGQGTGLGLSLSYDIVKAHGGQIKVNTNEGVEFTVILPVH
ncbi:MAG TPA: ATP-binding protein [Mucilaginibacter sp.]|jgi:signal transduction histidine kinase